MPDADREVNKMSRFKWRNI